MNQNISKRFAKFLFLKCRTTNTCGRFIGPEWARLALNNVLKSNNFATYQPFIKVTQKGASNDNT